MNSAHTWTTCDWLHY